MNIKLFDTVFKILVSDERSRSDDMYLLAKVLEKEGLSKKRLIKQLKNWSRDGLPNYDEVTSMRQLVQNIYPDLIVLRASQPATKVKRILKRCSVTEDKKTAFEKWCEDRRFERG